MAVRFVYGNVPFALEIRLTLKNGIKLEEKTMENPLKMFNSKVINHFSSKLIGNECIELDSSVDMR